MASDDTENLMDSMLDDDYKKIIEADKRMTKCFRNVFSSPEGKEVLHQILTDLKFYDECISDTDIALNNYAKFMIFKRLKVDNKKQITELLLKE